MKREDDSREAATVTTSGKKPTGSTLTEGEYLALQAGDARAAIGATLKNALGDSARVADPRLWARSYPWATVAAAAVAGFAAAVAAVPSRQQQELRLLAEYERLTAGVRGNGSKSHHSDGNPDDAKGGLTAWIWLLLKELLGFVKPALSGILASYLSVPKEHQDGDPAATHADDR